jgi:hypothetical protein
LRQAAEPGNHLLQQWPIEAQLLPNGLDLLRRGVVPGNDHGGVAGCELQQQEHEYGDQQQHRDGRQHPPDHVTRHAAILGSRSAGRPRMHIPPVNL